MLIRRGEQVGKLKKKKKMRKRDNNDDKKKWWYIEGISSNICEIQIFPMLKLQKKQCAAMISKLAHY